MQVKEKCQIWENILLEADEEFFAENPEERAKYEENPPFIKGAPAVAPERLPVWNSDETVQTTPMLREWFSYANGWSEFMLGRRALSFQEMQDPWIGVSHYRCTDPEVEDDSHEQLKGILTTGMKFTLDCVTTYPEYKAFKNPRFVLFALPILISVSGVEFLVFEKDEPDLEPMVFLNDYVAKDIEDMLDWLIKG